MHAISQDIASFLRQSDGARTIINLNNDGGTFAKTLIEELRLEGIGVAQGNKMDYLSLNYRVEQLNPRQFFVSAKLSDGASCLSFGCSVITAYSTENPSLRGGI